MDFWVEEMNWRKFGSQRGTDDWDFYREKYGQYFSRVDWDSGPLQNLSSYRHSSSHFRIGKSLNADEWEYIMRILARIDVSPIKHMELELPHGPRNGSSGSFRNAVGMDRLKRVLGSGRFSGLQTLRIKETSIMRSGYPVDIVLGYDGSVDLAEALEFGRLTNLLTLSLPGCDVRAILGALKDGYISQIQSLSIRIDGFGDLVPPFSETRYLQLNLSQNLEEAFESGRLRSLQHLDFSSGVLRKVESSGYCLQVFLRAIESGKVPNVKSLCLSNNGGSCKLADLVPLLLSTPLENLIMDGCQINSVDVERFTNAVMDGTNRALALKRLVLHNNILDDGVVRDSTDAVMDDCQMNSVEFQLMETRGSRLITAGNYQQIVDGVITGLQTGASHSALELKRLDLHNNILDDRAVRALKRVVCSGTLAHLQDLDLSGNSGMTSRALTGLMASIQRVRHPSFKLLIRARDLRFDSLAAQAIVRLYDAIDGRADEWYQVIYRSPKVTRHTGHSDCTRVTQYSVQRIQLRDMKQDKVDWNWDLPHCLPVSGSSARSKMEHSGTILESSGFSTVEALRLRITSQRASQRSESDPAVLRQGQEESAHLAAALFSGQLTSRLTRSLPAAGVGLLTLSVPECDVCAILEACTENHLSSLRAFSIMSIELLDDLSQSSVYLQKLDAALERGCFNSLQHLELSNGVLDGADGWKVFTRAINSGTLPNVTSLRLSHNALNRINLEDLIPLILSNSLEHLVMDNFWIDSEQVRSFASALIINCPAAGLALKCLDLHDNMLGSAAVNALVNLANSDLLPRLQTLNLGMNLGIGLRAFESITEALRNGHLRSLETLIWVGNLVDDVAAEAIIQAYYENEDLKTNFDISWNQVSDPALKKRVEKFRAWNIRLRRN